jgi:nondiscriminating glutamyl-tRNA synthetase
MSHSPIRVRFAPSPTGYLHIGGARTALYNYLFAKATGGTFILRIEDTDLERSQAEYEKLQMDDLKWLGIFHDEGPDKPNPKYGPYRQSERLDLYQKFALRLIDEGHAYYDFCTEEELDQMRQKAEAEGRDPHYDGKWKDPQFHQEALDKISKGEKPAIRFRAPKKPFQLIDLVKGSVTYPEGMVGDFVIVRSSGLPVYNYCCVVDDHLMDITHVIRGEDHLNNTVRQLMIYEALGARIPHFAHVSLLIGHDRQKLSKRHGATSVNLYRNEHYLPQAMCNYLCLLGWSHPEEKDIFTNEELIKIFNLNRFSAHAAMYDLEKLKWVNSEHLKMMDPHKLILLIESEPESEFFKEQSMPWKMACVDLLTKYCQFTTDFPKLVNDLIVNPHPEKTDALKDIMSWESTSHIMNYISDEVSKCETTFISEGELSQWTETVKKQFNVKGKHLFQGMRAALTGKDHGPELKQLIPLTPVAILKDRINFLKRSFHS